MQRILSDQLNLSERIRSLVRERIVEGELVPDTRLNEVHLAEELGVSRTPIREALMGLVAEGALRQVPRRGFFVCPLTVEEFRHLYPIRALLDPEALRLSGLPDARRLSRLKALNERLREEKDVEKRVRTDDAWHLELLGDCPNPVLIDLIRQFMLRTRRYELAFYRSVENVAITFGDHLRVIEAAEEGDLEATLAALRTNLTSGTEPILRWLEAAADRDVPLPRRRKELRS